MKDCTSLALNSDKCFENFVAPSSPTISSYENLLRTPTPPKVTAVPEDILQVSFAKLDVHTPSAMKPVISRRADVLVRVLRTSEFGGPGPPALPGRAQVLTSSDFYGLMAHFSLHHSHLTVMATLSTISLGGVAGKARNAVYPAVPRVGRCE